MRGGMIANHELPTRDQLAITRFANRPAKIETKVIKSQRDRMVWALHT
jgi:hypothetical protein